MRSALRWSACTLALCHLALAGAAAAAGGGFAVERVWFEKSAAGYAARASLQAGPAELLEKILRGGYEAQFNLDVNFYQRREWLPDPVVGDITWRGTLSYESLTQRYVLATARDERIFATLAAAMREITELSASPSSDGDYIKILQRDDVYLRARFYLATAHLPEPVQIGLLVDDSAQLDSDWQTMVLEVTAQ